LARLKNPVLDILKRIVPPGMTTSSFSELSVDEAVHLAQLHPASNQ
jgi:hypothetical protein